MVEVGSYWKCIKDKRSVLYVKVITNGLASNYINVQILDKSAFLIIDKLSINKTEFFIDFIPLGHICFNACGDIS